MAEKELKKGFFEAGDELVHMHKEQNQISHDEAADPPKHSADKLVNHIQSGMTILPKGFIDCRGRQEEKVSNTGDEFYIQRNDVGENADGMNPVGENRVRDAGQQRECPHTNPVSGLPEISGSHEDISGTVNGIYISPRKDYEKYSAAPKQTAKDAVFHYILDHFVVKIYDSDLCVLRAAPVKFERLQKLEVFQFIDQCAKQMGSALMPGEINFVRLRLLYNNEIAVKEKDAFPSWIWPFADGLININSEERIQNFGQYFYTSCFSCPYVPQATCPTFDQFLTAITGGNPMMTESLWEFIGYILANDMNAKKFFVLCGPKDSGKSLFANVIAEILGPEMYASVSINDLAGRFVLSELKDKRLALCMDLSDEALKPSAVGLIKSITGGDYVRSEAKYEKGETIKINAKFLFGTNHPLRLERADPAFADRMMIFAFRSPVPKEKQDKRLFDKLRLEREGIAANAIRAYRRLVANNYIFPEIEAMIPEACTIDHEKVVADFFAKFCDTSEPEARISTDELYRQYKIFTQNMALPSIEKGKFSGIFHMISKLSPQKIKFESRTLQGYKGIRLRSYT